MPSTFGAVHLAHEFLKLNVKEGDLCIDCTAGRGKDTAFLCGLVGESGKVVALDIQPEAIESTKELISELGYDDRCGIYLDSHENVDRYAEEGTVAAIVFNFGWLPGGDHSKHTQTESSLAALRKCLRLLKFGGVMSLSIYYGRDTGFEEKDAILSCIAGLPVGEFAVVVSEFVNRPNCPPISVRIYRTDL